MNLTTTPPTTSELQIVANLPDFFWPPDLFERLQGVATLEELKCCPVCGSLPRVTICGNGYIPLNCRESEVCNAREEARIAENYRNLIASYKKK